MALTHPPTCTCRLHPLPASLSVRDGRAAYLAENGFTVGAYDAKWTEATLLGLPVRVPNTPRHAWAIRLHDLHHVATGFGTDLVGEGEISAWELRGGLGHLDLYVRGIVASLAAVGWLIAPRRTHQACRQPGRNLFSYDGEPDALLELSIGELRARLGLPCDGVQQGERRLHARAPVQATRG